MAELIKEFLKKPEERSDEVKELVEAIPPRENKKLDTESTAKIYRDFQAFGEDKTLEVAMEILDESRDRRLKIIETLEHVYLF